MKKLVRGIGVLLFGSFLSLQVQAGSLTNASDTLVSNVIDAGWNAAQISVAGAANDILRAVMPGSDGVRGTYSLRDVISWIKSRLRAGRNGENGYRKERKKGKSVPEMNAAGASLALAFLASMLVLFRERRSSGAQSS